MRNLLQELKKSDSRRLWKRRFCSIVIFYCVTSLLISADAQAKDGLEIEFVTEKKEYVIGEPVILNLAAHNTSKTNIVFNGEDNFGFNGYRFKGLRDKSNSVKSFRDYMVADGLVIQGTRFNCQPSISVHEQIVLQRFLDLSEPGTYTVSCEFCTRIGPEDTKVYTREDGQVVLHSKKWTVISNKLSIVISPFDETKVLNAARQLSEKLADADVQTRQDAAEALGYFHGSDAVISNVMSYLVNTPADDNQQVRGEIEKAINRLKSKK